jgi:DNA-binding transcriptional LysR family regulator
MRQTYRPVPATHAHGLAKPCAATSAAKDFLDKPIGMECTQLRNVRVDGQLVFNGAGPLLQAALNGFGLVYLMERHVQPYVSDGRLVRVLSD